MLIFKINFLITFLISFFLLETWKTLRFTNTNILYIPRYRTNRLQRCIKYHGVKIWKTFLLKSNQHQPPYSNLLTTNLKTIYSKTIDSTQTKIYLPNFPCRISSSYNIILVLLFH